MSVLVKEPEVIQAVVGVVGFSEESVRALSASRNEPAWMLELRLAAWRHIRVIGLAEADGDVLAAAPG